MNLDYERGSLSKKPFKKKGVILYLKVHVMPKLNMPLRGKAWYWIAPVVLLGLIVIAFCYFSAN